MKEKNINHLKLKAMKKQDEIQILQSLKGHGKGETYFGDYFKDDDIDQMCENIKNDYPIELDTNFNKKAEVMEKRLVEERKRADEDMMSFIGEILIHINNGDTDLIYDTIKDKIGIGGILHCKHEKGINFSQEEIDWMFNKAKEYF